MTIGKKVKEFMDRGDFVPAKTRVPLTPGDAVRIARKMLGISQNDLSKETKIPQSAISGIESGRIALGVDRAKVLARALKVHPAVLAFPSWDVEKESDEKIA
jgi:ribosome-binding protein aMBF1 (putative translation factor)